MSTKNIVDIFEFPEKVKNLYEFIEKQGFDTSDLIKGVVTLLAANDLDAMINEIYPFPQKPQILLATQSIIEDSIKHINEAYRKEIAKKAQKEEKANEQA